MFRAFRAHSATISGDLALEQIAAEDSVRAERDASGNGLDRIDRKGVEAGRASPLFPNVAETMARVLGVVKSRKKKSGRLSPDVLQIVCESLVTVGEIPRATRIFARYVQATSSGFLRPPDRAG